MITFYVRLHYWNLCEISFSALIHIKSRYRVSLKNVEKISCPAVSNIAPRLSKKQNTSVSLTTIFPLLFVYVTG